MEKIDIPTELKSHLLNLYKIALSDGNFSSLEMKMLYEFADERGVNKDKLNELLLNPGKTIAIVPMSIDEKLSYLIDFCVMSWADGKVVPDEENALKKFILNFGFLDENVNELAQFLLSAVEEGKSKKEIINLLNS
jgi:uncharacterized tellurite resistance protein B-like protein